jgi:aminomethyltransferase
MNADLFLPSPGLERYRVPGGGAAVLALAGGDRVTILDVEGRQRCELAAFSPEGQEDLAALGARADGRLTGLAEALAGGDEDAEVAAALRQRGISVLDTPALRLFGGETRPGDQESFTAVRDAICVIAAPGGPMRVDAQDPPTDLTVFVERARVAENVEVPLPPPLGGRA